MLVQALRSRYNSYAVFFYNEFTPDVVAVIWRPDAFKPKPFTATVSEFQRPVMEPWKDDSLVVSNIDDLMAEIRHFSKNIISHVKVGKGISKCCTKSTIVAAISHQRLTFRCLMI